MSRWAADHEVALEDSWAYSDSLLRHAAAAGRRPPRGRQPRPPPAGATPRCGAGRCSTSTCPPGVPKIPILDIEPQRLVQTLVRTELLPWVRFDIDGLEHIPDAGPAIVVANHRSYFDPLALGATFARTRRPSASSASARCSTPPWSATWPGRSAASGSTGRSGSDEPLLAAAAALASRRARRDPAPGHHPPGPGVLRARADGPVGRRPSGRAHRGAGDPDGAVGHREGLAAVRAGPAGVERHAPADGPGAGRPAGRR